MQHNNALPDSLRSQVMLTLGRFYVDLARRIEREVPGYDEPIYLESIALLESQIATVEEDRRILFHDDFGNLYVQNGELQGLFDLENCRLGVELMQLSKGLEACEQYGLCPESFLETYEEILEIDQVPTTILPIGDAAT